MPPKLDIVLPSCGGEFVKGKGHLGLMMTLRSCERSREGVAFLERSYRVAA
jgi:hypothetical protein